VREEPLGSHNTHAISGDFSLTFKNSYLVIDGEIKSALKPITVNDNPYRIIKKI